MGETALVPVAGGKGLAVTDRLNPEKEIEFGTRAAKALVDVVKQAKLSKKLGGDKEHLQFEAWQTLGQFYNATPQIEWTKEILDSNGNVIGYNSRAVVSRDGHVIGAAEARCGRDEEKWNTRPKYENRYILKDGTESLDPPKEMIVWERKDGRSFPKKKRIRVGDEFVPLFQLESMSQTRAQAKALRSCFAWVVVLAGYQATPLEEMEGVVDAETTPVHEEEKPRQEPHASMAPQSSENDSCYPPASEVKITEKQRKRFYAVAKGTSMKPTDEMLKDWLEVNYGYKSTADITQKDYADIIAEVVKDFSRGEPGSEG